MIQVSHLVKSYGSRLAVDDVSFHVGKGEVVGFLGPNGAGKSTTLRILSGFLGMTGGDVKVAGHDILTGGFEARRHIGYMPEAAPLYPEMRVAEYLQFRAELKRVPSNQRRARVDDALARANVVDVANLLIGKLSKGYRQRVGLADALVSNPPLLILDEPTAGLDPNQIRDVRDLIRKLAREHTVLLSTHILSEVEAICTRVIVIAKGKLVAEGPTADIRKMRRATAIDFVLRGDGPVAERVLRGLPAVAAVKASAAEPGLFSLSAEWAKKATDQEIAAATERSVRELVAAGVEVREVRPVGGTLEEVFVELTHSERPPRGPAAAPAAQGGEIS
jgi:ABC-2 type transport system ATP-binding protein